MAALRGAALDGAALEAGLAALQRDVQIAADAPGGMVEFRRSLAASFLFKGLVWAAQQLEGETPEFASPFPDSYRSGARSRRGLAGSVARTASLASGPF